MVKMNDRAEIGIFGGSGFYDFLDNCREVEIKTKWGEPSDKLMLGELSGRKVAFLPRHGKDHRFPPHKIPYKANIAAFKELGVSRIIAPCACGSLQPDVAPGDFVVCDQFVDRTNSRDDTFFDGPEIAHISSADPYCPQMRQTIIESCRKIGVKVHETGTVVVINGPRFSTRSESKWFSSQGWEVINMTQYPEVILARELGMCYANIALITDYDVGLEGDDDIPAVTAAEVMEVFKRNNEKVKEVILDVIANLPSERTCSCATEIEKARF